jgi:2-dehydro-3-deoxyglucarate aldolase
VLILPVTPKEPTLRPENVKDLRNLLKKGHVSVGSWMQLADSNVAELLGTAGYDWVAVDLEHGRYAEDRLPDLFRALVLGGTLPFARLGHVSAYSVKAALEAGAQGLIFPMMENAEQVHQAISWAHYPPRGSRGVGYSPANLFGKNFVSYSDTFDPFLVVQIEQREAAHQIDAILDVKGVDAIMIGPYDLSASMGLTGQFDHPDFKVLLKDVVAACAKRGVPAGQHVVVPDPRRLEAAQAEGYRFIAYCTDAIFLWTSAARPVVAS